MLDNVFQLYAAQPIKSATILRLCDLAIDLLLMLSKLILVDTLKLAANLQRLVLPLLVEFFLAKLCSQFHLFVETLRLPDCDQAA